MRKISMNAVRAFYNKRVFISPNTRISMDVKGNPQMFLFDNRIAWIKNGTIWFNFCGWNSVTTRERLRTLGIDFQCRSYNIYHKGELISIGGDYDSGLCLNDKPNWLMS